MDRIRRYVLYDDWEAEMTRTYRTIEHRVIIPIIWFVVGYFSGVIIDVLGRIP